jgi:hypothetical protein
LCRQIASLKPKALVLFTTTGYDSNWLIIIERLVREIDGIASNTSLTLSSSINLPTSLSGE